MKIEEYYDGKLIPESNTPKNSREWEAIQKNKCSLSRCDGPNTAILCKDCIFDKRNLPMFKVWYKQRGFR
jgi:hypothetical protein